MQCIIHLCTCLLALSLWCNTFAQTNTLTSGQTVEKKFSNDQAQSFVFNALAGQFIHLSVEQREPDLKLALFAPDNQLLVEIDFFHAGKTESLVWLTTAAGAYRLDVQPADKGESGAYQATLNELRAPSENDQQRLAAQQNFLKAEALASENKAAARQQSLPLYEQALQAWRALNASTLTAVALYGLAENHRALNQSAQAIDFYQQTIAQWRALGDRAEEAAVLSNLAGLYNSINQRAEALLTYQQALALFRALDDKAAIANSLYNLGSLFLNRGELQKAQEHFSQSLSLSREARNRGQEALAWQSLGEAQRQLGNKRQALKSYEEALRLRRALNNAAGITASLNSLCAVYLDLGEMQTALDHCALSLARQRSAATLNILGRIYDMLGAPEEALQNYEQALALARAATTPAARLAEARALNFMGLSHWTMGNAAQAVDFLNQSLPISRALNNPTMEAAAINNLGLVYNSQGQWQQALDALNQALPLLRAAGNRQFEAYALNNLGFAYEGLRDVNKAFDAHQQALKLAREVRDRQREAKINFGLARLERDRNRLRQARGHIEKTIEIVEAARAKLTDPSRRAEYRAATQQYYELYVDVLMRLHKRVPRERLNAEALHINERARARSLIELLTEANADIRADAAPELVERERALQDQLNDKTTEELNLLSGKATPQQLAAVAQELDQLNRALRDVRNQLRQSSPRYAALTQPQPLTVNDLRQRVLTPDTLLLEYALGADNSYLWALTTTGLRSYTLPKRSRIEPLALRFYAALTDRNTNKAELRNASVALSKMLLAPVAAQLGHKRLLIVADGALQYVPFGALPVVGSRWSVVGGKATLNRPPTTDHRPPLISRHEIITLPSASTLAVLRDEARDKPAASKQLSVFADPVFERQDERIKTIEVKAEKPAPPPMKAEEASRILLKKAAKSAGVADGSLRIARLPFTRNEAEAILALAPQTQRQASLDFAASREAATSADLGQARIVHFATHGFLNSLNPELSGLVLSLVNEQGNPQNGYLLAPEFYSLRLPATELAVLSACQTGLGKEVSGEGLVGLTRGLMYAGVPRVVVSLWSVNDEATAELMKAFYQGVLTRKLRPAVALRAAQLSLAKQKRWQAPYYWAAFTLQGEWR